ncbi:MAG: cobalamin biosynthesis protein CobD [Chloroflexi bacterium]|nr:cobalamin biosynthesis protein CobD [Chloroflexota bacterium]
MERWLWPGNVYLDAGLLGLALLLDLLLPEPPNAAHPVAWIGKGTAFCERRAPKHGKLRHLCYGLLMAIGLPLFVAVAVGAIAYGLRALSPIAYVLIGALLLRGVFTVRGLGRAGRQVERDLAAGNIACARESLRSLVSRETAQLSPSQAAGAAVESVAENTTDSFIAPWLAFGLLGLPGAFFYRAVNTLDSMIGYRGRYEWLGKASARLDDALNFIPARVSAMLLLAAGLLRRLDARRGWRIMRRDHALTASPNAGWTMGAAAGLLGVALEKQGHYLLGEGLREPSAGDIGRAVALCYAVGLLGAVAACGVTLARACAMA